VAGRLRAELEAARREAGALAGDRDGLAGRLAEAEAEARRGREAARAEAERLGAALADAGRQLADAAGRQEDLAARGRDLEERLAEAARGQEEAERRLAEARKAWEERLAALQQASEQERQAFQEEIRRRGAAPAAEAAPAPAPAPTGGRKAPPEDDTFWALVGRAAPPVRAEPSVVRKGAIPAPAGPPAEAGPPRPLPREQLLPLLRWVGDSVAPTPAEVEEVLRLLGDGPLPAVLEATAGGDCALRTGAGRVCRWLAEREGKRGQMPQAVVSLGHAVQLFFGLAAEFTHVAPLRAELANTLLKLGTCQYQVGQVAESLQSFVQGRDVALDLWNQYPGQPVYRRLLALAQHDLALLLTETGRLAEAEASLREAVANQAAVVAALPQAPQHRTELERMEQSLRNVLAVAQQRQAAGLPS
jgi:tetratricopeptide (TPR) repeat protein